MYAYTFVGKTTVVMNAKERQQLISELLKLTESVSTEKTRVGKLLESLIAEDQRAASLLRSQELIRDGE